MFKKFKETQDKENLPEKTTKPRNQILEIPKKTSKNFENKTNFDKKKDIDEQGNNKENVDRGKSKCFINNMKEKLDKRNKKDEIKESKKTEKTGVECKKENKGFKEKRELFINSLKETRNKEEVKKYNKEHGYEEGTTKRPKGGWERERVAHGMERDVRDEDSKKSQSYKNT